MLKTFTMVLIIYLCALALMFAFQRKFLYFPDGEYYPPHRVGAQGAEELFPVTPDGLTLVSWYWPAQEGEKTIVFFHGNAAPLATNMALLDVLLSKGFGVLAVGYRGYPGAQGTPTEQGLYADARTNIELLLHKKGISMDDIILLGQSLGTGVAVQMATEYPAHAVVLLSPFDSVRAVAQRRFWFFFAWYLIKDRYASSAKINQVKNDIVIFHGTEDWTVPMSHGKALYEAIIGENKDFIVQKGKGHNDLDLEAIGDYLVERYS